MGDFTIKDMLIMPRPCRKSIRTSEKLSALKPAGISEQELKEAYVAQFRENMTRR